ncbi:hypothetical protein [Beijerinckia indica]|nr:hypothetical protein [Beijerinckia indica]
MEDRGGESGWEGAGLAEHHRLPTVESIRLVVVDRGQGHSRLDMIEPVCGALQHGIEGRKSRVPFVFGPRTRILFFQALFSLKGSGQLAFRFGLPTI